MFHENDYKPVSGRRAFVVLLAIALGALYALVAGGGKQDPMMVVPSMIVLVITMVLFGGLFSSQPGDAAVLILFGEYKGTVKTAGLWWANPFITKTKISLRVRNFETAKLKVNDLHANPIEIAAIVVWKVIETAEALFEVDDYQKYVTVQSESAVRAVAQSRPYDSHTTGEEALSITWIPAFARRSWIADCKSLATISVCVESASSPVVCESYGRDCATARTALSDCTVTYF